MGCPATDREDFAKSLVRRLSHKWGTAAILATMKTVTRRQLSHDSARILDEVLATGEPVEVVTRGRASVIIAPKPVSVYDQWKAQGLVKKATARWSDLAPSTAKSSSSVEDILNEVRGDH